MGNDVCEDITLRNEKQLECKQWEKRGSNRGKKLKKRKLKKKSQGKGSSGGGILHEV